MRGEILDHGADQHVRTQRRTTILSDSHFCSRFLEGPKVETEMLSVKMHQTEATSWNQTKSEFGVIAAKKATTEATQLLERERVRTIEHVIPDLHAKEGASSQRGAFPGVQRREWEGQQRIEELCSKFLNRTQDFWRQHSSETSTMNCCGDQECRGEVMTLRELWPRQRKWLMAPHQWKWPLMETKNMAQAAKVVDGAASVEVAADGNPANNQSPEADGWSNDNVSLAPTDPKAPPISVGCAQSIEPTVAETIAQGWCESCVRGRGGCVRGRGRDHPHRRRQDQMRDTQHKSFSATILLQRGEEGHHMPEN